MKHIYKLLIVALVVSFCSVDTFAGNKDRVGQAGANELLINPWARSAGIHSLNTASAKGIEAMRMNVAGLAFTEKTQLAFSSTRWLEGSGISVNALGFAQRVGDSGVFGLTFMSLSPGEIVKTTENLPDGGTGETFKPQFLNIGLAYSHSFSTSIHGGMLLRVINHSISNIGAFGVGLDIGIQYVTGEKDNFKFGIALRNVGTPMKFSGDGLDFTYTNPNSGEDQKASQRAEKFELPTLLNIGLSYDFLFADDDIRATVAGNFTSNSFRSDFIGAGLELGWRETFMLRAGYKYEDGMFDYTTGVSVLSGFAAGFTVALPNKDKGAGVAIDYAFRSTRSTYNGNHTLGITLDL